MIVSIYSLAQASGCAAKYIEHCEGSAVYLERKHVNDAWPMQPKYIPTSGLTRRHVSDKLQYQGSAQPHILQMSSPDMDL